MKTSTGEHIKSFDRAAMSKAVDKPSNVTSIEFDQLWNKVTILEREITALIDKVEWMNGRGKVGTVWVIEKDKGNE
jgi:hypothetical protein